MLTKREFLSLYDETVLGIRQIKNNNDKINKSIGVLNEAALYRETQAERAMVEELMEKVQGQIGRMEKNYLDPDTARKIGVVKQQLRIQRDRRHQLLESVNQTTKQFKTKQKQKQEQLANSSPRGRKSQQKNPTIELQPSDYNPYKRSQLTDIDNETSQSDIQKNQVHMQMGDYDFEIERKLLQDRSQQLAHAHQKMLNIKNVVHETSNLVYEQGDKLDIIGDDLFHSYKNVTLANTELDEANKHHKKSRKKYMVFSLFLLIIIGIVLFLIFGL